MLIISLEEKLQRRECFIETLAEKLAECQAMDRQQMMSVGSRSLPVIATRDVQMPEEESKVHTPQQQESMDVSLRTPILASPSFA